MNTIEIFCCYAHEDRELLLKLKKQLAPLLRDQLIPMDFWYDARLLAGAEWEREVYQRLNRAHMILLLVSPDFMASDYCYGIEMKRAMERHERGEAQVIPIILRRVHWEQAPFGTLQALPKEDAKPVTSWHDQDEALFNVVEGIREVLASMSTKPLHEPLSTGSHLNETARLPALATRSGVPALAPGLDWKWDRYTVAQTLVLHHTEPIASIALSSNETALASDGWDNTLVYWTIINAEKVQRERTLTQLSHPLYTVSFQSGGSLVAGGGDDAIVRLWDCRTGREVKTLRGHSGPVSCVAFSPDGNLLASASYDTSVKVWNPSQGHLLSTLTSHQDTVGCVTFLSSATLASGGHSGSILIYKRNKEAPLIENKGGERPPPSEEWDVEQVVQQPGPIYSIALHQPSGALISGAHDGGVRIWDLSTGQLLQTFTEHKKAVSCVAVSSTGRIIASGSWDKTIQVRRMEVEVSHRIDNHDLSTSPLSKLEPKIFVQPHRRTGGGKLVSVLSWAGCIAVMIVAIIAGIIGIAGLSLTPSSCPSSEVGRPPNCYYPPPNPNVPPGLPTLNPHFTPTVVFPTSPPEPCLPGEIGTPPACTPVIRYHPIITPITKP